MLILFFSKTNFSRQEALLYIFEDSEAVIKMIINGRSPTMRHVSRTHRVGCLIESIWTRRFKSIFFDTKNQLADTLTMGNFTRDAWNHF